MEEIQTLLLHVNMQDYMHPFRFKHNRLYSRISTLCMSHLSLDELAAVFYRRTDLTYLLVSTVQSRIRVSPVKPFLAQHCSLLRCLVSCVRYEFRSGTRSTNLG